MTLPIEQRTCRSCVFFDPWAQLCRALPPVLQPNGKTAWPGVDATDWCGSWSELGGTVRPADSTPVDSTPAAPELPGASST